MDPMLALTIIAGIIQVFANWLSLMAVILEFAITICETKNRGSFPSVWTAWFYKMPFADQR